MTATCPVAVRNACDPSSLEHAEHDCRVDQRQQVVDLEGELIGEVGQVDGRRRLYRLDPAKSGAVAFVNSLPPKFNVSLVSFAGSATTVVPPTLDRGAVTAAIQSLQPQPSTAIGEGIYTSLAALNQQGPCEGYTPLCDAVGVRQRRREPLRRQVRSVS